jgi:hypothetical protein
MSTVSLGSLHRRLSTLPGFADVTLRVACLAALVAIVSSLRSSVDRLQKLSAFEWATTERVLSSLLALRGAPAAEQRRAARGVERVSMHASTQARSSAMAVAVTTVAVLASRAASPRAAHDAGRVPGRSATPRGAAPADARGRSRLPNRLSGDSAARPAGTALVPRRSP